MHCLPWRKSMRWSRRRRILRRIFFQSLKFGLLSVIPLTSAVILNFGFMGWFGVDLSHFTALLTSIIIGVGVDFAIHYISEYQKIIMNCEVATVSTQLLHFCDYHRWIILLVWLWHFWSVHNNYTIRENIFITKNCKKITWPTF